MGGEEGSQNKNVKPGKRQKKGSQKKYLNEVVKGTKGCIKRKNWGSQPGTEGYKTRTNGSSRWGWWGGRNPGPKQTTSSSPAVKTEGDWRHHFPRGKPDLSVSNSQSIKDKKKRREKMDTNFQLE